ncbi:unannotated protein [freshwater metagenome]|uniref:Unannotated protein n=1 Tax=freshwater metagenome TaxID=449393 RepID=A0A6J6XWJ8_9ZZZZ
MADCSDRSNRFISCRGRCVGHRDEPSRASHRKRCWRDHRYKSASERAHRKPRLVARIADDWSGRGSSLDRHHKKSALPIARSLWRAGGHCFICGVGSRVRTHAPRVVTRGRCGPCHRRRAVAGWPCWSADGAQDAIGQHGSVHRTDYRSLLTYGVLDGSRSCDCRTDTHPYGIKCESSITAHNNLGSTRSRQDWPHPYCRHHRGLESTRARAFAHGPSRRRSRVAGSLGDALAHSSRRSASVGRRCWPDGSFGEHSPCSLRRHRNVTACRHQPTCRYWSSGIDY